MEKRSGGVLFVNRKKEQGSQQPDYQGSIELTDEIMAYISDCYANGDEPKLDLAGWVKQGPKAGKFISLAIKKNDWDGKRETTRPARGRREVDPFEQQDTGDDLDDEIPF